MEQKEIAPVQKYKNSKAPWLCIGISFICVLTYIIAAAVQHTVDAGTLIMMFVTLVPIQLMVHVVFTNAINNNSFGAIAGYDSKTSYNMEEYKRVMTSIDIFLGIDSAVFEFLLCSLNLLGLVSDWVNAGMLFIYVADMIAGILLLNLRNIDKLYLNDADKQRAKKSMPVALGYFIVLFASIGALVYSLVMRDIENNSNPALKLTGLFLLVIFISTVAMFVESSRIKKWDPENGRYRVGTFTVIASVLCVLFIVIMAVA